MQKALGLIPSATYTCALLYVKFYLRDGTVFNPGFEDLSSPRTEPGKKGNIWLNTTSHKFP